MADLSLIIKALNEASPVIEEITEDINGMAPVAEDATKKSSHSFDEFSDNVNMSMLGIFAAIEVGKSAFEALQSLYEDTVGKTLEVADEISELMRVSGDAPENLSALRLEAQYAGVDFDDLYKAMENLNKNGIPPTVDNLVAIAEEYAKLEDPIDRARYLTEEFGSAGDDIAPMLDAIADGVTAVDDAGLIFTDEEIQNAEDYAAAVAGMGSAWEGFSLSIGTTILPSLTDLVTSLGDFSIEGGGIGGFLAKEIESVEQFVLQMQLANVAISDDSLTMKERLSALWTAFGGATPSVEGLKGTIAELTSTTDDLIMSIYNTSQSWDDFTSQMAIYGLDIGMLTEEIYNQEKALDDLNNTPLEDKDATVTYIVEDSEVREYKPPNKTGAVSYIPSTGMNQAVGGAVYGGNPYTWQEYGYKGELFVPSSDGFVMSRADAERALSKALTTGGDGMDAEAIGKAVAKAIGNVVSGKSGGGNVYNLTMPTSSNPADVRTAFELLEAWNA